MKTAIVIDDNTQECAQIAGILARLGVRVVGSFTDGAAGLAALRRMRPDLATVDIQMPGMNGLDVARAAQADALPTRVVLCSGTTQRQVRAQGKDAGAVAFIGKPYDHVLVGRALHDLLACGDD